MKQFKVIITDENGKITSTNFEGKSLEIFREVFSDKEFINRMNFLKEKFIYKLGEEMSKLEFDEIVAVWKTMLS
ncbi:MAG TPA: hypothetical protein PK079_23990 [Leptospiraceae bacterium]|nr:hypothetical protein [Leptospiraceae bacterium]HMW08563.1 hypothetical protein [Leptospiraceae bacterium]HMZ66494.1 hypothetical protein [Leptospiraceae bacterium]HNA10036.1 hypothetical protein [Leptospiraceae bacterium]HNC59377.1 hypothetical protein [Leptospiraceae bacterium]